MKIKIKLLKSGETKSGAIRLQSQLCVGRGIADFILEDNILKTWNGSTFKETNMPYEIVENKKEMIYQQF